MSASVQSVAECLKANTGAEGMRPYEVGLDSMASVNLVRDAALLTNLRKAAQPVVLTGASGEDTLDTIGDFGPWGEAWYYPNGRGNVISKGLAVRNGWVPSYLEQYYEEAMEKDGVRYYFSLARGRNVYTCDMSRLAAANVGEQETSLEEVMSATVEERL